MSTRSGALLGVLAISFSAIFVRLASVSPATAAFYRMFYALPLLVGLCWGGGVSDPGDPGHRRGLAFLAGGVFAVDLILFHTSIAWIGAGLATLLANTQVVFVAALGWFLHGERPRRLSFVLLPLVLAGMAGVSGFGRPEAYGVAPIAGTLAGAGCGIAYAAFLITFRAAARKDSLPVGAWLDATLATGVVCLLYGVLGEPSFELRPTWSSHGWLFLLALVVQVLGWLLINEALPRLPALDTSIMIVLQPVFALVWGWIVFGENLSWVQAAGVVTVVGSILAMVRFGSVRGN